LLRALREARSPEEYAKVSAEFGLLEVQQLLTKRLSAYREFSRKLPKRRWLTEDKLWFVDTVTGAGGATVAVAGLTSCWASGEDREDQLRYLTVGRFQTRPALEALKQIPADVRIVMLHHPLECLQLQDERALKGDPRGACDILLRGHLHDNVLNVTSDPDRGLATLAAGSAYETEWTRNGYLLTRANIHDRRVVLMVSARRWSAEGAFFCADVGTYFQGRNTGILELELSRND
jgi:hypothetical protein